MLSGSEKDLASIVIPCYKQDQFLAQAIESALAQTYSCVEVIVVDDGCPGETARIAGRYESVRLIRQPNAGLAAARNAGFRASRGEYLVFLDADDRLLPHALERGLAELRTHPQSAFAYGGYRYIGANGERVPTPLKPRMGADPFEELLRQRYMWAPLTVLYRRATLDTVGGFNTSPSLRGCEDLDIYLRIAGAFPVHGYAEVIAEYRRHDTSMSHNSAMMLASALAALRVQAPRIRGHERYEDAYREGLMTTRRYFGGHLGMELRRFIHAHRWSAALGAFAGLIRYYPAGLVGSRGRQRLRRLLRPALMGTLRRIEPLSSDCGRDRGTPLDRYYIEDFLEAQSSDVRGRVLEMIDNRYTRRFGTGVTESEILDIDRNNPNATIFADLAAADAVSSDSFDCFILSQALHLIFDPSLAIGHAYRILRPGGVLLCTVPAVSRLHGGSLDSEYWRFTKASCQALFAERFGTENVSVRVYGNVLTGIAFLTGMAAEELSKKEVFEEDPHFPLLIAVRAMKV